MSVEPIETSVGPRWLVRREVSGKQRKKYCRSASDARRLDAAWKAESAAAKCPYKPVRESRPEIVEKPLTIVDQFLRMVLV